MAQNIPSYAAINLFGGLALSDLHAHKARQPLKFVALMSTRKRKNVKHKENGFDYVVNPPPTPKIAFGSCVPRVCLPQSGPALSSFMRREQGETRDYPGPLEYVWRKELMKKLPSVYGHLPFVSKVLRFPPTFDSKTPPIGAYDSDVRRPFKPDYKPFGTATERKTIPDNVVPGPPTYSHHIPYPKQKRIMAFGTAGFRWPAVFIFCGPVNTAKCYMCLRQPYGDYFRNFDSKLDMCRPCMKQELKKLKSCDVDLFERQKAYIDLRKFMPARYCGFFHDHNGTTAAVQLISRGELIKKTRTENYLYRFERPLA